MFTHTLPHPTSDSRPNFPTFSSAGQYGLPNSVREALLGCKQGEASLIMDALLYCGFTPDKWFTLKKALAHLRKREFTLSKALVRRALNSGSVFKCTSIHTHRAGRPEKVYALPRVMDLVKQYAGGSLSATDVLEVKDMQGLRLYRQGLHREFIRRAPGIYSRSFLGRRLGVGQRTTHNYDRRVGIRAIRRLGLENLRLSFDWRARLGASKVGLNWLRIVYKDGRTFDAPLLGGIVLGYLWKKTVRTVYLVTQRCNRYVYAPEDDWADYQYLYQHDDHRAFAHSNDPYGLRRERLKIDPQSITLQVDRKAYQPKSDPISAWVPPELAARRISRNPFLPRHHSKPQ